MQRPNKFQLASITAASILVGYIAASALMQTNQTAKSLDIPPVLIAEGAAVDYFLKIEGIDGESTDDKHPGWIEIQSWSWGESNRLTSFFRSSSSIGKVNMQDFHFTMKVNKASPKLMLACATGEHFKMMTLVAVKGEDRQEFLTFTLTDTLISSYQTSGMQGDVPSEHITVNFSKIEYEYKPMNRDGSLGESIRAGWDVKTSTKV
ncbi:MAG: type VI secretion system tube protein Hcp [Nitrososphaera sp.]|nr:type VI secretion system tube protein Hcp [Nitrososphaera sp.]